ncbi:MAG: hypothetical protein M3P43_13255 [Actinomycetota bacterium]|nr:hypothetical protein [Actinomycetota bacterium]
MSAVTEAADVFKQMLAAQPLAFPSVVSIEIPTVTRDDEGGEDEDTSTRAVRHVDVPCQFADVGATFTDEDRIVTGTFEDSYRGVFLLGDWPEIELTDVLVHDGDVWDIRSVGRDDWKIVTHLVLERRNP